MPQTNNIVAERKIQEALFQHIDDFRSFRFNAGAGAGKTYALIETMRYILEKKIIKLKQNNQQVLCITYTNVAVNEIRERLGSTEVVLVSTIHERLWDLIKPYQVELIKIHKDNLNAQVANIESEITNAESPIYADYVRLSENERQLFKDFAFQNRELIFSGLDLNSRDFRALYASLQSEKPTSIVAIGNVTHFKNLLKKIFKLSRYKMCILRIEENREKRIEYDSRFNSDRLEYMKFSHDTLLEYSEAIFKKYPKLQRIITDKYPYVFVDEYQDTSGKVVSMIKALHDFSKTYKKDWLVGYFGDTAQNIYDNGVGGGIQHLHQEISQIDKIYNRRSHCQIIEVANKIRNDEIKQLPIFDEKNKGIVEFYYFACEENEKKNKVDGFIADYKAWLRDNDTSDIKKLDCLVLTNKLLANLSGFGDVYDVFSSSEDIYFNEVNTKILSNDLDKLHPTILIIYKLTSLFDRLQQDNVSYLGILGKPETKTSFVEARRLIIQLKRCKSKTLFGFLNKISYVIQKSYIDSAAMSSLFKALSIDFNEFNKAGSLKKYIRSKLISMFYKNAIQDADFVSLKKLAKIEMDTWRHWHDFVAGKDNGDVIFHTYHGTKGEEYENVAIIMEHGFGRSDPNKFKDFFANYSNPKLIEESDAKKHLNTKNLLYVVCSRAIKNLKILYLDDVAEIKTSIEAIFGEVKEFV